MSPRKRLVEAEPEEPPPSASEQLAEMADERELETVREATGFLDSFAGIANLRVTIQKTGDDGQFEHVKNLPLDSKPDEEFIAKKFGPGRYRLIVRGPKSDRYPKGYYGQTKVNIAELAPPKVEANSEPGELNPFMKMLMDSQEKRADEFKSLLLAVLAGNNQPKGGGVLETITALSTLGLIGKDQGFDPQKYASDIQAAWREGRRDADGSERPEGFAGVIHEALPIVRDGIEVMRNAQRPQPPQRALPAAPASAPAPAGPVAPAPPAVDVTTLPPWLQGVYQYLGLLRGMAAAGMDPEDTALQILKKLTPEVEEALALDVAVEGWEAKTLGLLPPQLAQAHEGWTRAVLAAIKAELTAPPDGAEPDDAPAA